MRNYIQTNYYLHSNDHIKSKDNTVIINYCTLFKFFGFETLMFALWYIKQPNLSVSPLGKLNKIIETLFGTGF